VSEWGIYMEMMELEGDRRVVVKEKAW